MILFPKDLIAYRPTFVTTKGQVTRGAPTEVPFRGNIQPLSNKDAVALNVGRHDIGKVTVFSNTPLQEGKMGTTEGGDIVKFQGQSYEIIQESSHQNGILPHYTYTAELRS